MSEQITWRDCTREEAEEYRCWSAWSNPKERGTYNWTEWNHISLHLNTSVKYEYRTSKPAPKQFAPNATPEQVKVFVETCRKLSSEDAIGKECSTIGIASCKDCPGSQMGNCDTNGWFPSCTEQNTAIRKANAQAYIEQHAESEGCEECERWRKHAEERCDYVHKQQARIAELEKENKLLKQCHAEMGNASLTQDGYTITVNDKGIDYRVLSEQLRELRAQLAALEPLRPYASTFGDLLQRFGDLSEYTLHFGLPKAGDEWFKFEQCGQPDHWVYAQHDHIDSYVDLFIRRPRVQYIPTEIIQDELIQHLGRLKCEVRAHETDLWREGTLAMVERGNARIFKTPDTCYTEWQHCRITTDTVRKAYNDKSEDAKKRALEALPWLKEVVVG